MYWSYPSFSGSDLLLIGVIRLESQTCVGCLEYICGWILDIEVGIDPGLCLDIDQWCILEFDLRVASPLPVAREDVKTKGLADSSELKVLFWLSILSINCVDMSWRLMVECYFWIVLIDRLKKKNVCFLLLFKVSFVIITFNYPLWCPSLTSFFSLLKTDTHTHTNAYLHISSFVWILPVKSI